MNVQSEASRNFSRRGFLGLTAAAAAVPLLAACGGGSSSSSAGGAIKFWDMPWATPAYNDAAKKITEGFSGANNSKASYQQIQWANFTRPSPRRSRRTTGPRGQLRRWHQAFQFESQGKIAYADNVLDAWKKNGIYDDFLPGLVDTLKTENGYAAVPYNLDMRVFWYRKYLLDKAGAAVPTDWTTCSRRQGKLKKIGVYGYGTGSGAGQLHRRPLDDHAHDQQRRRSLRPRTRSRTASTPGTSRRSMGARPGQERLRRPAQRHLHLAQLLRPEEGQQVRHAWDRRAGAPANVGAPSGDLLVASPLTGPHGKKGALYFPNNIMMYKNTPSQEGLRGVPDVLLPEHEDALDEEDGIGLPPLKSIAELPEFANDPNDVKIINEWQPIAKTWAAPGSHAQRQPGARSTAASRCNQFTQTILDRQDRRRRRALQTPSQIRRSSGISA